PGTGSPPGWSVRLRVRFRGAGAARPARSARSRLGPVRRPAWGSARLAVWGASWRPARVVAVWAGPEGAPGRRPRGGAGADRRAAAQWLPDHPGDRRAQQWPLASELGLRVPGSPAARGRGADPLGDRGGPALVPPDRGRPSV